MINKYYSVFDISIFKNLFRTKYKLKPYRYIVSDNISKGLLNYNRFGLFGNCHQDINSGAGLAPAATFNNT